MTRAATDAATTIKPMIVACTMTIRAICNEEAEAPAGKVAEAPPSHHAAHFAVRALSKRSLRVTHGRAFARLATTARSIKRYAVSA
jgi:hypothetical protein